MEEDISLAAELGVRGVVFGVLDETGAFDTLTMSRLVQRAKSLKLEVTCHRAFDVARDPYAALDTLIDLGVDRLLTSGQAPNAVEGLPLLRKLVEQAKGRISIMPGRHQPIGCRQVSGTGHHRNPHRQQSPGAVKDESGLRRANGPQ